jgi:two-component system cell cycle sensor histidine kinase/response regulator CckA
LLKILKNFLNIAGIQQITLDNPICILCTAVLILLLISSTLTYLLVLNRKKRKKNEYFLKVIRTVSKVISKNHEIAAFNENNEIIYTTHPHLYTDKDDFFKNLMNKVMVSCEFKDFYKCFETKKTCKTILSGAGSGLKNEFKKWDVNNAIATLEDSLIDESISVITINDISKHLRESEKILIGYERLEEFLDHLPLGIFYIDDTGKIMGTNATFANFVNLTQERIIGLQITEFIRNFENRSNLHRQTHIVVTPNFSKEFKAILLKVSVNATSHSQPWLIFKCVPTEHVVEANSNEFIEQESFVFAPIPSVIVTTDGEIKALNPAFATMIQDNVILEKDKIMQPGTNFLNFIYQDTKNDIANHLRCANSSDEKPKPVEMKFAGGNTIAMAYVNKIDSTYSKGNRKNNLLLIQLIDISGQKKLEQQFIQSQKMHAIGQLAGGIAHDFNNLLTAMIGFCDLLLQRYTQNDPSYGDVVQIKQNAGRAANLVRQLLAFSKQQTLKPRVVSITDILVDLSSLLKRLVGANIEFQVTHGRDIWPVKVDHGQFEQIIMNLVVNARDAMENGGNLTIRTKNYFADKEFKCIYDTAKVGDYVLIEVIDTGCGIESNIIESIFEPFFSKKRSSAHRFSGSGTGLGLSTVYGIVDQTGGFVNVESEIGKGSNFKIYIPRYTGPEKIQTLTTESVSRDLSGSETILLVEDEDAVRMFSARALRDKGYKVLEASCGEEAIEISKNEKFDLLITDVVMPKIDGPTLSKVLGELIKDLKTIFISGYTEDAFRQDVGSNSNIHFLQKPFTLKNLISKVKEVITRAE